MAALLKMAALFFLLNLLFLVNAHKEHPSLNELVMSSESESSRIEPESPYRRRGREWQYEGMPIQDQNYRRAGSDFDQTASTELTQSSSHNQIRKQSHYLQHQKAKTFAAPSTTTTIPTTKVFPPLNARYRRIFNPDETASIEDYPFMAAVLVNKELWCGAAIIDRDRVLTAAHCLQLQYNNRFFREYVKMLTVRVGSNNATAGGEVLRVVEIAFHPNYKPSTLEFNVAVLRLHKNLTLDNSEYTVARIQYSRERIVPVDNNIHFLGWGSVLGGGSSGGTVILQKVELPIYDIADCQQIYGRDLVTHTNFCAGFITKAKNVCNHDAGGPAILDNLLTGILSFSSKRCDKPDQPAVFTSVGAVAPWLETLNEVKPKSLKMA